MDVETTYEELMARYADAEGYPRLPNGEIDYDAWVRGAGEDGRIEIGLGIIREMREGRGHDMTLLNEAWTRRQQRDLEQRRDALRRAIHALRADMGEAPEKPTMFDMTMAVMYLGSVMWIVGTIVKGWVR